jgi:hypothetical protein
MAANRGPAPCGGPSLVSQRERKARAWPTLRSTMGRPRALTSRQIRSIVAAYDRFLAWKALRRFVKSQRQLAEEFGVSMSTVGLAIRSRGQYKQASPERRAAEKRRRERLLARLRAKDLL